MQAIVGAFKDTSEPKQIQMSGLHVANQKYMTLRADDNSIYLKQVRHTPHPASMRSWT